MAFWNDGFFAAGFWDSKFWDEVVADAGTETTNSSATTADPNNYLIDDLTGWKVYPGDLQETWRGTMTRQRSFDQKHPQEDLRGRIDRQSGPQAPEGTDNFLAVGEVSIEDL